MGVKIHKSTFSGGNLDGSPPFDLQSGDVNIVGWHCIGPAFCGKPTMRQRIAWSLLGVSVEVRPGMRYEGSPPAAVPRGQALRVIQGGKSLCN